MPDRYRLSDRLSSKWQSSKSFSERSSEATDQAAWADRSLLRREESPDLENVDEKVLWMIRRPSTISCREMELARVSASSSRHDIKMVISQASLTPSFRVQENPRRGDRHNQRRNGFCDNGTNQVTRQMHAWSIHTLFAALSARRWP